MERAPITPEEQKFNIPAPERAELLLAKFGPEAVLRVYGMEGVGRLDTTRKGSLAIICPLADPRPGREGKFINILPPINLAEVIKLFGSEEATIEGFYRPLGYKGPVKFSKSLDGKDVSAMTSLGDVFRTAPTPGKALLLAIALAAGGAALKICNDTPGGAAAMENIGNSVEQMSGGEEEKK